MKPTTKSLIAAALIAAAATTANRAQAQEVIGFDDYNTAVLGIDYVSRVFSPDNANANGGGNAGAGGQVGFGGAPSPTFAGSGVGPGDSTGPFFDLWGVAQRSASGGSGEPFDVYDDSNNGFPPDVMGYNSIGTDGFVVAADTVNNDNSDPNGNVQVNYVFDITGYENLQVSIDWGAWGILEADDSFTVSAGINGGTKTQIMEIGMTELQEEANTLYTLTMADGDIADIYFNPFFDDDDQAFLEANIEQLKIDGTMLNPSTGNIVGFHIDDVDQDGRIDAPTATRPDNTTAAHFSSGSDDQELEPYARPLYATTDGFATVTQLSNILETIIADVEGTGDTLELEIAGVTNGSIEYIIFDNIEILGTLIGGGDVVLGDVNDDGIVDSLDISPFVDLLTGGGFQAEADINDDGVVDSLDISPFVDLLTGATPAAVAAIPEPSSLALLAFGGLLVARRRRG